MELAALPSASFPNSSSVALARRKARAPQSSWRFPFYPLACFENCALGLGQRLLELLEHAARALKRFDKSLNISGRRGGRLLQLQDDGHILGQSSKSGVPVNGAVVGQKVIVALPAVVVDMRRRNQLAGRFDAARHAAL